MRSKICFQLFTGLISVFLLVAQASATIKLDGYFIANHTCEAFQSKKNKTNPGDVTLTPRIAYDMVGINKQLGDYFQIKVPDAPVTEARWVHVSCGVHVVRSSIEVAATDTHDPIDPQDSEESSVNLLALSWQPSFCELKTNKTECQDLNNGFLPVTETQLSIHGLWAQPRGKDYCGVPDSLRQLDQSKQWDRLPELDLSTEVRDELNVLMPGSASFLHRHEWIKHGTCHLGDSGAEEYYADTIAVTNAINRSGIGDFLAAHVGAKLSTLRIREQFDLHFGEGAGDRVQFHCAGDGGRVLLQELKINLKGIITPEPDMQSLLLNAEVASLGCPEGVIDAVGLQ